MHRLLPAINKQKGQRKECEQQEEEGGIKLAMKKKVITI